ncbi:MAG TPA: MBL fold hydrolase [Erysipelotrichaceae bacterium]|nr:MBL fold hydrolase [Erysipelotrichaceae bacterium]
MEVRTLVLGLFQTNTYLLVEDGEVVIIDPVSKSERIQSKILEGERVVGILLTHGHFDHIGAVDELAELYQCPVYLHYNDYELTQDPQKNYSQTKKIKLKSKLSFYEDHLHLGQFNFFIHHTPGHTPGSVCIEYKDRLFTGDTLFKHSVGRTDLYKGSSQDLKQSLRIIAKMDPHLVIYPGHEEQSTLADEFKNNPYF